MSDQCCKCGWIGTDDEKVVPETQKHQLLKNLVCPECGNDDFYSPPIKPTARMKRYQQRADLARVTAERDDYRERWEQTGCTRHHAMETAIKLNESCRQQLEAAIQERDALREALDFYACVDHYAGGCADDVVSTDRGAKARAALKVGQGEGEG